MIGFSDEAVIVAVSGNGGSGAVSFRREKYVPRGGPDGGDGGKGGSVIFVVKHNLRTLAHLRNQPTCRAENGQPGQGRRRHGRDGNDVTIEVPPGTLVREERTRELIVDLADRSEPWVFLEGGKGGKGNWHFRSSTRQAPRYAQGGLPGEERRILLELRIIADIGFVGFPNAGKSSLLNYLTNAHAKVAGYPFTTKIPHLGVFSRYERVITLADIPGIIEGASSGAGLGLTFLKHITRTSGIAYLIDVHDDRYLDAYDLLRHELGSYSSELTGKPEVIIATKMDLPQSEERLEQLASRLDDRQVIPISVFSGRGIDEVREAFFHLLS